MTYLLESQLVDDCRRAATALGVYVEVFGQRKAKDSGTTRGAPDLILYAGGKAIPCELKRPKTDGERAGRYSLDQLAAAEKRRSCGVETFSPATLEQFVALVNHAKFGTTRTCQDCPTVPGP